MRLLFLEARVLFSLVIVSGFSRTRRWGPRLKAVPTGGTARPIAR